MDGYNRRDFSPLNFSFSLIINSPFFSNILSVCSVHGARFIKRVCDKQTCYLATILLKTVLQNCQCHRMMKKIIHRNIRCCCPNPRFQEKCHENYGILSRIMYRYELFKKQCITRKFVDENKVGKFLEMMTNKLNYNRFKCWTKQ